MSRRRESAFDRCVKSVSARGSAYDPRAVCAAIGRRKYGQAEMTRRAIAGRRRAARMRNPIDEAASLSEAFHGRPAETVTEYEDVLHHHSVLMEIGPLGLIKLRDGTELEFEDDTMLSSNESGTQMYIVGGDQSVDLSQFPELDDTKEAVCLGKVKKIEYFTSKHHLGKIDETPGWYKHTLGEESGELPMLDYDTVNGLLSFVGGSYHIDIDMPGGYSAGIRD